MKKGLTGILRPNGEFISCNYGNHGKITVNIPQEEEFLCIYFSGTEDNNTNKEFKSMLYLNDYITPKQLSWIAKNIDKLDETQYKIWIEYIENSVLGKM